ncbi:MAG TPA: BON domain-containing protein [Pirellulales bacterium]|jgi:hypothetical protein|nr:BON domain-containing protein [Pirellulales bacterium]
MRRFILGVAISAVAGLSPAWAVAADQEAAQRIAASLRASGRLTDYSLGVQYEEGTVWLSGRVADEQQMDEAVEMARNLPDVTDVVNNLEIRPSRPATSSAVRLATEATDSADQQIADEQVIQVAHTSDNSELRLRTATRNLLGMRGFASPAKVPTGDQAQTTQQRMPTKVQPRPATQQRVAAPVQQKIILQPKATVQQKPTAHKQATVQMRPPVQAAPAPAALPAVSNPGDPGDPLARSGSTRFAPASSRRSSSEPVIRTPATPRATGNQVSGNRPASYDETAQPVMMAPQQGEVVMQGEPAGEVEYEMAMQPQAAAQGQLVRRMPTQQTGFFHHHRAPPYGPPCGPNCGPYGGGPGGYPGGMSGPGGMGGPVGMGGYGMAGGPVGYDNPQLPNYAWPSYAAYPNYAALTYPTQYSAAAWPYIGPFYPYPQVPLGWRKVALEWDDGWWFLSFHDRHCHH